MEYLSYKDYKPSIKEWLGTIPKHWQEKRVKFTLSYIGSGKTPMGGANVYVNEGIKLIRSQNVYDDGMRLDDVVYITDNADELQANTRIRANDVLLNITGASIGRASVALINVLPANVNQHVCILRSIENEILPAYLHKLLCSKIAKNQIFSNENGTSREGLNFPQIGDMFFPFPQIEEQRVISHFVDHKTAHIEHLIEKKKILIEKLNEKRIALITQAVTKGLNPDVPMKLSGVGWLGDVPSHWIIKRLKFSVDTINNKIEAKSTDLPYLGMENIESFTARKIYDEDNPHISDGVGSHYKLGHVLFGKLRPYLAKAYLAEEEGFCSTEILVFQAIEFIPEYLTYFVLSDGFIKQVNSSAYGSKMPRASWDYIGSLPSLIPPIVEQVQIVDFINKKTKEIDGLIRVNNQTIERLTEYRTALITAAVTGKIDVRAIEIPNQEAA